MNKLHETNLCNKPISIGALPSSYLMSLSYEEQLLLLSGKMDEIINFMNNQLTIQVKDYIDKRFNEIMIDAMYEPETETLVLSIVN